MQHKFSMGDIYDSNQVRNLFDEMSQTYGLINLISSLGFTYLWRKACVNAVSYPAKAVVCDLMAGGAECYPFIKNKLDSNSHLLLVDFSEQMCSRAQQTLQRHQSNQYQIFCENALDMSIANNSIDVVVSAFGLKTFDKTQTEILARQIHRILKPNGQISLLEISLPTNKILNILFTVYVKYYVPFFGRLLLGNPENYRMLWEYTQKFGSCKNIVEAFGKAGFQLELRSHFLGSASQIVGRKI